MSSPDPVVVGYWYGAKFHFCVCYGPVDEFQELRVDDRIAWEGSSVANETLVIAKQNLFGGQSREGGLSGSLYVKMGASDQTSSDFGGSAPKPAYRGVMSLVWQGLYAAMNPYMKPWAFKVKRITQGWKNDECWYPEKAEITISSIDHMNPAHIIYECLTNNEWGMGYPASQIDDTQFREAADALYTEGFGISLMWNQQGAIKNFISEVLDHIQGILRNDPSTGKFVLKLVRDDYDEGDLDIYDESIVVSLDEYSRSAWGETVNEVTVTYVDQTTGKQSAVTVHDLANVQGQGALISKTQNYAGIPTSTLATQLAMRDLKMGSTPLARYKLSVNRSGWQMLPGDVFKFSWSKLGIEEVVLRILDVSVGSLESNTITVTAIEDIFSLPSSVYVAQEPIGWTDPSSEPADSPNVYLTEIPYWTLSRQLSAADLAAVTSDDCYNCVLSDKPSGDALSFRIWSRTGVDDYVDRNSGAHCPTAVLFGNIGKTDETITFESGSMTDVIEAGSYAYIENAGGKFEAIRIDAITDDEITCKRGVLDTVPVDHTDGAIIYFGSGFESGDRVTYADNETIDIKIETRTGQGVLDLDDATEHSVTTDQRQARPYPPGLFRINTNEYPATITGELTVSWAHRDRLQQTAYIVDQDEASIGPEAGTTYTILIYGDGGVLKHTITGETGTSYTLPEATEKAANGGIYNTDLRVVLKSVRDGLDSWTSHEHTFTRP